MSTSRMTKGVRAVAVFEATKGIVVLLVGFGLLTLLHQDARVLAARLIAWLNLNPTKTYSEIFLNVAAQITDKRLWAIAAFAAIYAAFRFVEAYGLWKQRSWAEWLAVVSGTIYVPVEVYELTQRQTWVRVGALVTNVLIVGFMAYVLYRNSQAKRAAARLATRDAAVAAETGTSPRD